MCGICGIINYNSVGKVKEDCLRAMTNKMIHRGPDDAGVYVKENIGLGHRRLKIIDLTEAGRQPMSNEDGTIWIVLNGEIYNYKELRQGLTDKGHAFKSHTDTEVVIHLYEEYGVECIKYLRGMFAFGIWDEKEKLLLLARDRIGKKPLLYSYKDGVFCFASEFSSLLESGFIKKEINYEAIDYYLTFGYIPAPLTIYKDVFKLLPAHRLILKDKKVSLERYWSIDVTKKIKVSEEDASSEIIRLLKEAVKIRLYSDVPLGVFLSGGIDSSTVVALMAQVSGSEKVKTFSIGFQEHDYSELKYARKVAEMYSTDHYEFIVKPHALDVLPLLVKRYGEPYADSSCIPTYYVSQQARRYITVALNGDGGDELFAGYKRYQAVLAAEFYQKMPYAAKRAVSGLLSFFPDATNPTNILRDIKRFFDAGHLSRDKRYLKWVGIFENSFKEGLYSEGFKERLAKSNPLEYLTQYLNGPGDLTLLDKLLITDINTYLPNDLLVKVDIASMANSLEVRSPFLDHVFIEFVAGLPAAYKMRRFIKKYILKKAIRKIVPEANIRRRKMGFALPVAKWLREELKDYTYQLLLSPTCTKRGYFNREALKQLLDSHVCGMTDHSSRIWALINLELWHQMFIDNYRISGRQG